MGKLSDLMEAVVVSIANATSQRFPLETSRFLSLRISDGGDLEKTASWPNINI